MSFLQIEGLTAFYGSSQALFGVDLEMGRGDVTALMGRNGMGKSTTVKAICRMIGSRGVLRFDDRDLQTLASHQVGRLGIGLVPEGRRCFASLTVRENLIAAARHGPWDAGAVCTLFPRLEERFGQRAATLSGGEQQMLAIGRALMTNPSLLVLDEATEGLAPLIRQEIWAAIRRLREDTGVAILLIDKSVKDLAAICNKAVILERGRTIWSGYMADLDAETSAKYIGV